MILSETFTIKLGSDYWEFYCPDFIMSGKPGHGIVLVVENSEDPLSLAQVSIVGIHTEWTEIGT